jgi:seryl-tRNA synthetase
MTKLFAEAPIDEILELDRKRRALLQEVEQLKQQRNVVSKEIGKWAYSTFRSILNPLVLCQKKFNLSRNL